MVTPAAISLRLFKFCRNGIAAFAARMRRWPPHDDIEDSSARRLRA
jgi:hypothetical protein